MTAITGEKTTLGEVVKQQRLERFVELVKDGPCTINVDFTNAGFPDHREVSIEKLSEEQALHLAALLGF